MNNIKEHLAIILVPLIISNILHMIIVKRNYFAIINIPISDKLFGKNKTWRGLITLTLLNAITLLILSHFYKYNLKNPFLTGAILGLAYMLFELPNSFLKRRLKIPPGNPHPRFPYLFKLLDKTDSSFGVTLTYFLIGYANLEESLLVFIICIITHISFSIALVNIKLKPAL